MLAATSCGFTAFAKVDWHRFDLVFIDLIFIASWRIIWDLHFILVHRRVFSLTIMILYNHDEDVDTNDNADVVHLDDLSLVSSILSSGKQVTASLD